MSPAPAPVSSADRYRIQAFACRHGESNSPFYADLLDALALDADTDGPAARVLEPLAHLDLTAGTPLRLLAGVHRLALDGSAPRLAAHFPSTGGDADVDATVPEVLSLLGDPPASVLDSLGRDPQTNEVGRAAALAVGLTAIASTTDLPLRVFELGSSAGLNLRLDAYRFEGSDGAWGDVTSPLVFGPSCFEGITGFGAHAVIASRRGCDLNPIDATGEDGRQTLLSYVWPDQVVRLERLRAALALAATTAVTIDRAAADDWVIDHVRPEPGTTTVLMHSIVWQYLPADARSRIEAHVAALSAHAEAHAPMARLRFEPAADWTHPETRVCVWPHAPDDRVVATSTYHGPPIRTRFGDDAR